MSSRLSDPCSGNTGGDDRVSAKDRLSVQTQHTSKAGQADSTSNSKRLQEVEIRYLEDTPIPPQAGITTRPSCSNVFDSGRLGPCERSPIRTLSEDRIHVSLRCPNQRVVIWKMIPSSLIYQCLRKRKGRESWIKLRKREQGLAQARGLLLKEVESQKPMNLLVGSF
ncbi:hypothetical protein Bca52824_034736 [Brassica carinata]|uniref:Uncharacterized protein n=1 Tax=Brassica carinata TaxID=52824 RepID=A0A8X7S0G0_BRACI|nr:hypothetical protein Bca52824_034736 [Brassica carinata]